MQTKLPLRRLIPVSAASAIVALGCGGKAVETLPDQTTAEGTDGVDGPHSLAGDGDESRDGDPDDPAPWDDPSMDPTFDPDEEAPGELPNEPTVDPLSDGEFNSALERHFASRCVELIECQGEDLFDGACTEYFVSNMHRIYDTESSHCREEILGAFACSQGSWSCEPVDDPCTVLYLALLDDCVNVYDPDE